MSKMQEMVNRFLELNPTAKIEWNGVGRPYVRQGDTFVWFQEQAPDGLVLQSRDEQNRAIVALGEVTGHAHAIEVETADIFTNPKDGVRWLLATGVSPYVHEEHATLVFPEGFIGTLSIQNRYEPLTQTIQRVWD